MNAIPGADPDWIVPDWAAPPNVKAFVTTRAGGVSAPPYDTLNLGLSTGDDPNAVAENRRRLRAVLPAEPRWLKQVHGARVVMNAFTFGGAPHSGTIQSGSAPGIAFMRRL